MTVLGQSMPIDQHVLHSISVEVARSHSVKIEPLLDLEWSRAVEPTGVVVTARRPAQTRRAWIHRAPQKQVVELFAAVQASMVEPPAPWWLRALAVGRLSSRLGGFAIEDQVSDVLDNRPGWVYVPWVGPGEDGYWEYSPSETCLTIPRVPTTILLTDRHLGWLDFVPAHAGDKPAAQPFTGLQDLRARVADLEQV